VGLRGEPSPGHAWGSADLQRARTRLLEPNCSYPQTSLPSGFVPGVEKIPALVPLLLGLPVGSPVIASHTRRDLSPARRLQPEPNKASRRRNATPYSLGFGWIRDPAAERARGVATGDLKRRSLNLNLGGLSRTLELQDRCASHAVFGPPHGASRVSPFFSRIDSPSSTSKPA
jgi:hypothetical protein